MKQTSAAVAFAMFATTLTHAAPLSIDEVSKLCSDAEGMAHCAKLVEQVQLKRLPGLAIRDGTRLRIALYPAGSVTFDDIDTRSGGTSYALWDHISDIDAAVLFTTRDDDTGFVLLQRVTGKQTVLPGEPVIAPDRQRLATADFCETRCENTLAVWRITRDGVRRESEWRPAASWSDAAVRWKDADTLVIEYTPAGSTTTETLIRKLGEAGWLRP